MAPLQGHTLGQRHKHYNDLVKEALARNTSEITKINFEEDDVDNMIKIDVACKEQKVEYILEVFKSDDMLYVSRAINKSTWLITEPQYSHIINPEYLHDNLFPLMNAKAVTKLMLHIRRHLKAADRVEAFYEYLNKNNPYAAMFWLNKCSKPFIKQVIAARVDSIPMKLLKRLCRRSLDILRTVVENCTLHYHIDIFNETKHFLKDKETAKEFVQLVDAYRTNLHVSLNAKYTALAMINCPETMDNCYSTMFPFIDLSTFAKYIKKENIKTFITNNGVWSYETLTPFLDKLPRNEIFEFLSDRFGIDYKHSDEKDKSDRETFFYALERNMHLKSSKLYCWYRFAAFDIAFQDIKKLISIELDSEERHAMLIILLTCAKYDFQHVITVLQYYLDKHINEPYIRKKTFIASLLSQHRAFRFDDPTWNMLNILFRSSDVYIESDNDVQEALIHIIIREVLQDRPVPEVVEDKFKIESFVNFKSELSQQEQDKIFNYLYNLLAKKISLQKTDSETGMRKAIALLKNMWRIIKDWGRVDSHNQFVIEYIVKLCEIEEVSPWAEQHNSKKRKKTAIYNVVKSYRKNLFEKSLVLNNSEEVLLNALKHDPGLLARYTTQVNMLRNNNAISLSRFLSKLRIYWSDTLAREWTEANKENLQKLHGHRALVRGILTLMPQKEAMEFIKTYTPNEKKIDWNESNEVELSIVKHIAYNMYIVRPHLPAEVVLWYAKGDYLQYALFSLRAIYCNLRSSETEKYITLLLNSPVSIQKHGLRLAFEKYKTEDKIRVASETWQRSRNSSIRAILFKATFDLLCNEYKETTIHAIWSVLGTFMDDLNDEENNIIYRTLGKVRNVPRSVVGDFFKKSFFVLKPLCENPKLNTILQNNIMDCEEIVQYLEPEFVEESLLNSIATALEKHDDYDQNIYLHILSAYLLYSEDLEIQIQKYNRLLLPIIAYCVPMWAKNERNLFDGFQALLDIICRKIPSFMFEKSMVAPVTVMNNIKEAIQKGSWRIQEDYVMIRHWDLTVRYIEALADIRDQDPEATWLSIRTRSAKQIALISKEIILEDQRTFYPSIYLIYRDVLNSFFNSFNMFTLEQLEVFYEMLEWEDCPSMYMLVLEMQPQYAWGKEEWTLADIRKKIYCHPSEEIHMHYFRKNKDRYPVERGVQDSDEECSESSECSTDGHDSENTDNTNVSDSGKI